MRRITLWLVSTVAAVVLLFSYRTSTNSGGTSTVAGATTDEPAGGTASSGESDGTGGTTYTGTTAQTRWGPVQVSITVAGNRIVAVSVPIYPDNNGRDRQINAYALPILRQETVAAQNADIDTVSGATVTSDGYKQSLQAAVDAAHLA